MSKLDDYQKFVQDSNCHREAIQKRLEPIRNLVRAAYNHTALQGAAQAAHERLNIIERDFAMVYGALGVNGEAGEYADKVKKYLRGDDGQVELSRERLQGMREELGDVSWYVADSADSINSTLEEVLDTNKKKIEGRMKRGTRRGDGDQR